MNTNQTTMGTKTAVPTIRTEKQFETALKEKWPHFIFEGPKAKDIAKRIQRAEGRKKGIRGVGIGLGLLCLAAAPFTAGTSLVGTGAALGMGAVCATTIGTTALVALSDEVLITIITGVVTIATATIAAIKEYQMKKLDRDRLEFVRK